MPGHMGVPACQTFVAIRGCVTTNRSARPREGGENKRHILSPCTVAFWADVRACGPDRAFNLSVANDLATAGQMESVAGSYPSLGHGNLLSFHTQVVRPECVAGRTGRGAAYKSVFLL